MLLTENSVLKLPTVYTRLKTLLPPTTDEDILPWERIRPIFGSWRLFSSVKQQPDTWQTQRACSVSLLKLESSPHQDTYRQVSLFSKWETEFLTMNSNDIGRTGILTRSQASFENFRETLILCNKTFVYKTKFKMYSKYLIQFSSLLLLIRTAKMF
jgi:hypothetical protein